MVKNIAYLSLLLAFASCSPDALYDKQQSFPDAVWKMNEPAVFTYKNQTPEEKVDIAVLIRTSVDYKYANMFVFMEVAYPDNSETRDTLQFILADPSGKLLGNRVGTSVEYEIPISENKVLQDTGEYVFTIFQGMNDKDLTEVYDLGIRIVKAEN